MKGRTQRSKRHKNNSKNALKCQKERTETPTGTNSEADSVEKLADMSTGCGMDVRSIAKNPKTAEDVNENVTTCKVRPMKQNSPYNLIVMPKRAGGCKHNSNNRTDTGIQQNALTEILETWNQKITFGRAVEALEAVKKISSEC